MLIAGNAIFVDNVRATPSINIAPTARATCGRLRSTNIAPLRGARRAGAPVYKHCTLRGEALSARVGRGAEVLREQTRLICASPWSGGPRTPNPEPRTPNPESAVMMRSKLDCIIGCPFRGLNGRAPYT